MWWVGLDWIFFDPPWWVRSKNPLNLIHAHPYLVDNKIWNRRSQRSLRYICVATVKGKPHTAWRWWHVLTGNFQKMGIGIIPWVYERSALTIEIKPCLLLIGTIQFGIGGLFAYILRGKIIRDNLFSLTAGRTLAFHRHHDRLVDRSRWVIVFEREDMVKEEKWRKCLEYEGNLS